MRLLLPGCRMTDLHDISHNLSCKKITKHGRLSSGKFRNFTIMFSRIISMFVCLTVLLQVCSKTCIYSIFILEKSSIIETFCENKNKPELHCQGSCFLKKELKEQEKHENQSGNLLKEKFDHFYSETKYNRDAFSESRLLQFSEYKMNSIAGFDNKVFQPPRFFWH